MIITIFSEDDSARRSILAINLAMLCAANHRKVLLVDATAPEHAGQWRKRREDYENGSKGLPTVCSIRMLGSELADRDSWCRSHYQDIIIDTDGVDSWYADVAMTATDVLVVPIRFYQGDLKAPKSLARRIESLRFFNPKLRILIVDMLALTAGSDLEQMAFDVIRSFANNVPGAAIADVIIREGIDDLRHFQHGLCVFDGNNTWQQKHAVTEVRNLYQEILQTKETPLKRGEAAKLMLHAIRRWTEDKADGRR